MPLAPGTTIGRYRIESRLGGGAMGVVYLALDERLERRVALKLIASSLAADPDFRARFEREARAAAGLDHPHVLPVYEAGEDDGQLYLAMRYVPGVDLATQLARHGPLDLASTTKLIQQLAAALDAAHASGLIHRDVKPANVLLAPGEHAYLADFGLARSAGSGITRPGQLLGTADYTAPELLTGASASPASDTYALACLAVECLTGRPPFRRGDELATLYAHANDPVPDLTGQLPELPAGLQAVIARGLAKDPAQRYPTAGALAAALGAAGHGEPVPPPGPVASRTRSLRWVYLAGVAGLLIAAVAASTWIVGAGIDRGGELGEGMSTPRTGDSASAEGGAAISGWVVFSRSANGEGGLRAVDLSRTASRTLTSNSTDRDASFSPQGRYAFVRGGDATPTEVYLGDTNSDAQRRLTTTPPGTGVYDPEWSPDGAQLVAINCCASGGSGGPWTIDPESGELQPVALLVPDGVGLLEPGGHDWADGGIVISYLSGDPRAPGGPGAFQRRLWVIRMPSGEMQEVAGVDAQDPLDPAWSPDGTRIAFSATHFQTGPENRDIYVFGIEDGELQRVTSSPAAENRPAWSPDGQHLAFLSSADGNSGVFVVSLTTGEISAVASGATEVYGAPTWVP